MNAMPVKTEILAESSEERSVDRARLAELIHSGIASGYARYEMAAATQPHPFAARMFFSAPDLMGKVCKMRTGRRSPLCSTSLRTAVSTPPSPTSRDCGACPHPCRE
jgi:hypothetical protein